MILLAFLLLFQGAAQPQGVQRGIDLRPDTVTIGDPFQLVVRIRAPLGSTIEFPAAPDSGDAVELLDPRSIVAGDTVAATELTAVYRLAAWDVGARTVTLPAMVVRTPTGVQRLSAVTSPVFVSSVLPEDAAERVPRPARDIFAPKVPWWYPWLPVLLAVAAVGLLLWWWWRRRSRRTAEPEAIDPRELAEREFARVEALGLLEAGERGRFVALMVEVMRDYLAARVEAASPALTSTELIAAARRATAIPVATLEPVLTETDLIKFARHPVSEEDARALGRAARDIVRTVAETPAPETVAVGAPERPTGAREAA